MKSLKLHFESLLDDDDIYLDPENDKKVIEEWIKDNYNFSGKLTISDDLVVVDCSEHVHVKNKSIEYLTNGLFRWGKVDGTFDCYTCKNLKSLEGAPEKVRESFYCNSCDKLETLEGAPKVVGRDFYCKCCKNLKTLKGAPKRIKGDFSCDDCCNLTSLKGAPEKINDYLYCFGCKNLKITDSDRKKYKIVN